MRLSVELTFVGSMHSVSGHSVNISETGILVYSPEAGPSGSMVRLDFPQDGEQGLGEVAWTRDADEGGSLSGISLKRQDRDILFRLLSEGRGW